jgi:hypothetical protein
MNLRVPQVLAACNAAIDGRHIHFSRQAHVIARINPIESVYSAVCFEHCGSYWSGHSTGQTAGASPSVRVCGRFADVYQFAYFAMSARRNPMV